MVQHLEWLRAHAGKVERRLRHDLVRRLRPPCWLPCFLHGLWYRLAARWRRVPVIVQLGAEDGAVQAVISRRGARLRHRLDRLQCVAADLALGHVAALCGCPAVRRIWQDGPVRVLVAPGRPARGKARPRRSPVPGALQAAPEPAPAGDPIRLALGLDRLHGSGLTGQGVTVAVVDTGVQPHPDLAGRLVAFRDLVQGRQTAYDDNGHGTHVAGCVAGSGAAGGGRYPGAAGGGRYPGAAPAAGLVVVKALDKSGVGSVSNLMAGIQWVLEHAGDLGVRVLSLSLGGPGGGNHETDPLAVAVAAAEAAGLVVCAAAGNDGPEAGTIGSPGISPAAVAVGAMDTHGTSERGDDTLAAFSSRGPTPAGLIKPDLLAPGVDVVSLRAPRSYLDKLMPGARVGSSYFRLSGTSMAAPLVAGICACLLQAEPGLDPGGLRRRLAAACQDLGLAPNEQGAGYLDGALLPGGGDRQG